MRKLLTIALFFSILSSLGHFYLAKRAYQLQVGEASASRICNIGENLSCDSTLLSPYSAIFGISLSNFGLAFNLVLSFLLCFFILFGASDYWKNISFYLAGGMALSSIVMALISLANSLFCPICWTLYLLSFLILAIMFFVFKRELSQPVSFILDIAKQKKSYILGASLLFISLFFHINFVTAFNIKSQKEILDAVFNDWQYETAIEIEPAFLLQRGTKGSKMVIVEFVDFLCPACKKMQPALKDFLTHFPDVIFQFYVYPLDGVCNPSIDFVRSGLSCELSQAIVCASKQGQGWPAHDFFFEKQNHFLENDGDENQIKALFEDLLIQANIDKQEFEFCMKEPSSLEKVKQSALAGDKVHIQGTPSFFINGKKVRSHSSKLLILKRAYEYLKKEP